MLDHIRLSHAAAEAAPLAEANKVRAALLAAVGHDFRTPLAAAKASVSTLFQLDLDLDAEDRRELLQGADTSLDRLAALVDNLLDMSRLQAGAMSIDVQPTAIDEVVARALDDLGEDGRRILIEAAAGRSRSCRPTPDCSSGSWRTSRRTPFATHPPGSPRT